MADILEKVMVDAPLPLLAVSILTSLATTVVPEEMGKYVDQITQQLEHYLCELGQAGAPSWASSLEAPRISSANPRWSASVDGSSPSLRSACVSGLPKGEGASEAIHWPLPERCDTGWIGLHGASAELVPPNSGAEVGLGHILQWLNSVVIPGDLSSPELSFGFGTDLLGSCFAGFG